MATNKPIGKWNSGGISVAVWQNSIETANGPQMVERVTLERRYKDEKSGEWKSTNSYRKDELPKAILVLQKAYDFLAFRKRSSDDDGDGQE